MTQELRGYHSDCYHAPSYVRGTWTYEKLETFCVKFKRDALLCIIVMASKLLATALSSVGCNYIGLPSSSSSQTGPLNPGTLTTIIRIYLPHYSRSRSPDSFGQDTPIPSPEKILLSFSFKLVSQKVCHLILDMISLKDQSMIHHRVKDLTRKLLILLKYKTCNTIW